LLPVNPSAGDSCVTRGAVAKTFIVWHFAAMKYLSLVVVLLGCLCLPARAQSDADTKYIGIYGALQQAEQLAETGNPNEALAAYTDVQSQFQQFQKLFPTWNPNIVSFRMSHISDTIADLKSRPGVAVKKIGQPVAPAPANAPAPVNPPPAGELDDLRAQLQSAQAASEQLQAKLKEALAVQPAAVDPRELQRAQEKIRALMKENDLLTVTRASAAAPQVVVQSVTNVVKVFVTNTPVVTAAIPKAVSPPAVAPLIVTNFVRVPDSNALEMVRLDYVAAIRNFNDEHDRAEQLAAKLKQLQGSASATNADANVADYEARLRDLTQERNRLMEKLDAATRSSSGGKPAAEVSALNDEVRVLRARLAVAEASAVPFTAAEQALFKAAAPVPANPDAAKKSIRALPAGTAELVASAQAHFVRQEFAAAEADYQKILERDPNNAIALANLAMIEMQEGKLAAAEQHLTAALGQSPDDAYDLSTLGYLKFQQEKYDDALNALSRAAQLDPNNPEIQNYLGVTLSHKGQRPAAESALRRAIQLNPNYAPAHNNLAVIYLNQTPPLAGLARWHYQKALDAGQPRNPDLEKMLADKGAPVAP
jgi:tetratricopeptide (TPR) repeat protein